MRNKMLSCVKWMILCGNKNKYTGLLYVSFFKLWTLKYLSKYWYTTSKWIQVKNNSFLRNDSLIHKSWSISSLRKSHKIQIPANPWKSLYPCVGEKWEMMIWIFSAKKISPRHDYFSPSHQWAILAFRIQYEYHSSTNGRKRL